MTPILLALTDAPGNLVRVRLMPDQRHDSVEVPPPIEGIAVGGLITDTTFDNTALVGEVNDRGAKVVISQASRSDADAQNWRCHLCMAALDRKQLMQAEGVQAHRHLRLQNRP